MTERIRQGFGASFLAAAFLLTGCANHLEFPPMGDPLPYTAKLEIPAALKNLSADYTDGCGHLMQVPVGPRIEEALVEGAYRTFKGVVYEGGGTKNAAPDVEVRVDFVDWSFRLMQGNVYDRVPADIQINAIARVYDMSGKLLRESEIKTVRQERLRIEPTQKNCDYIIGPFIQDTAIDFATRVSTDVRQAFGGTPVAAAAPGQAQPAAKAGASGTPASSSASLAAPAVSASSAPSSLRFKAMVLDENSNLVLEGGERVRVRVDVVNTGPTPVHNAAALLTGTPSIVGQFPATTLSVPLLQPGETKSVEFVATLPPSVQPQHAELRVAVAESGGAAAPSQTLAITIQPTGVKVDDVDQIPAAAADFKRPHMYLLSIGIGSYRDHQLSIRKYGASDAEMVATYFQSLGGLPAANVRLLQDWKALRPDIDEALLDWLPAHMNKDAVVVVYFAGVATVSGTGEVFLLPYDGTTASTSRAYPLKDLEAALGRLKAKHTVVLFDGIVSRLGSDSKGKGTAPKWGPSGSSAVHLISTSGLGRSLEDEKHRHGLFTYYLLRALRGESDTNRDGEVTLGETVAYLTQKVLWASKTQHGMEQRPLALPPVKNGDPSGALILSKLAAIRAVETP